MTIYSDDNILITVHTCPCVTSFYKNNFDKHLTLLIKKFQEIVYFLIYEYLLPLFSIY